MKKEEFTALGISEELAEKAEAASKKELEGYVLKSQLDTVDAENKTLKQSVADRDKQLDELKKSSGNNEALQNQIKELQDANKEAAKKHADELKELRLTNAIKLAVAGKVHDEDMAAALFDRSKLVLTEDGKVAGLEEQLKSIQEAKSFLFKPTGSGQGYDPAGGGGGGAVNPFAKDTFNLTEQGKLFRENPVQAREFAAAAGVKI
ncbi:MAG: hypothetical protein HFH87_03135 [Lachnospiraceae bacterium]|nr:hypothetical protein [Lachnospiraceae bacterium]